MRLNRSLIALSLVPIAFGMMACARTTDRAALEILNTALTAEDLMQMELAVNAALEVLPSDGVNTWENPVSGRSGAVTPMKTIRIDEPRGFCRIYLNQVFERTSLSVLQSSRLMACRQSERNWIICDQDPKSCVRELREL